VKRKVFTYSNAGFGREATTINLPFANMTDGELTVWGIWFSEHHEQDYPTPRERSYFRINKANQHAEVLWRKNGMHFS